VVTNTWKVLYSATANEDDGVFLEVVTFTADVSDDFLTVGKTHLGNLPQSGVRLLRCACHHLKTDATALWTVVKGT
jgi:hypothetical protein